MDILELLRQVLFASLYVLAISFVWLLIFAIAVGIGGALRSRRSKK